MPRGTVDAGFGDSTFGDSLVGSLGKGNIDGQPSQTPALLTGPVRWLLAAAFCSGILAAGCAIADAELSGAVRGWDLRGDLTKAINLSEVFAHGVGVSAILGAIFLVAVDRRRAIGIAILMTACSGLLANGLKSLVVRIRPYQVGQVVVADPSVQNQLDQNSERNAQDKPETIEASFWDSRQRSFPSGHAATAVGLAIGLSLVFPRGTILFGILAVLASFQRVSSGAHYPSDVLAGSAIAFATCGLIYAFPLSQRWITSSRSTSSTDE